jgi:ligand-binding SRPBCC domain-containing protein
MIELNFSTVVAAPREEVWRRVSSMAGVNAELGPWVRMTHPADRHSLEGQQVPLGEVLFRSWLLAFGILPFDLHSLRLERLSPGEGFDERSTSWMQRVWVHRRRLESIAGGTRISDRLEIEPRLRLFAPVVRAVVGFLFRHRHRRLLAQFGTPGGQTR